MNGAERRERERDRVRDGESRDGHQQALVKSDQKYEAEDEEQVVETREDVFDSEHRVGPDDIEPVGFGFDKHVRLARFDVIELHGPVRLNDANQHVGAVTGKPVEPNALARKAARNHHLPTRKSHPRCVRCLRSRHTTAPRRKDRLDR